MLGWQYPLEWCEEGFRYRYEDEYFYVEFRPPTKKAEGHCRVLTLKGRVHVIRKIHAMSERERAWKGLAETLCKEVGEILDQTSEMLVACSFILGSPT